jgi:hypothetical protein
METKTQYSEFERMGKGKKRKYKHLTISKHFPQMGANKWNNNLQRNEVEKASIYFSFCVAFVRLYGTMDCMLIR